MFNTPYLFTFTICLAVLGVLKISSGIFYSIGVYETNSTIVYGIILATFQLIICLTNYTGIFLRDHIVLLVMTFLMATLSFGTIISLIYNSNDLRHQAHYYQKVSEIGEKFTKKPVESILRMYEITYQCCGWNGKIDLGAYLPNTCCGESNCKQGPQFYSNPCKYYGPLGYFAYVAFVLNIIWDCFTILFATATSICAYNTRLRYRVHLRDL